MTALGSDQLRTEDRLLEALAEQLKMPLMQISQHVELAKNGSDLQVDYIEDISDMALKLIDSYILSRQINLGQLELTMEPVSIAAVLHDSAEKLQKIARQYNCEVDMHLSGRYPPVMANRRALEAALTALGYSLIEAQKSEAGSKPRIVLAAHRGNHGIVAGAFGLSGDLTSEMYKRSKELLGKAKQPAPKLSHTPGAGIFLADSLLRTMSSHLKVAHHSKLAGLAANFNKSPQLKIIEL